MPPGMSGNAPNIRHNAGLAKLKFILFEQDKLAIGAGEENRTLVLSLGSSCSTIELRPQYHVA